MLNTTNWKLLYQNELEMIDLSSPANFDELDASTKESLALYLFNQDNDRSGILLDCCSGYKLIEHMVGFLYRVLGDPQADLDEEKDLLFEIAQSIKDHLVEYYKSKIQADMEAIFCEKEREKEEFVSYGQPRYKSAYLNKREPWTPS